MRQLVVRPRANTFVVILAIVPLLVAGCGKLQPTGTSDTMQLLRDGSEKVCVATDVQATLRKLIMPVPTTDVDEEGDGYTEDQKSQALAAIQLAFELTTLQSFDKSVAKAMCNTTVTVRSKGKQEGTRIQVDYVVSPSAENARSFVVTGDIATARERTNEIYDAEVQRINNADYAASEQRAEAQQKRELLAVVNDKWLAGAWIGTSQAPASCGNGEAVWFEPNHVLEGGMGKGRWDLNEDKLHLVAQASTGPIDVNAVITQADKVSVTFVAADGAATSLRRCSRQETETLPDATGQENNG